MGVLPAPDVVRAMEQRISQLAGAVSSQEKMLRQIQSDIQTLKNRNNDVKSLMPKVEAIEGTLTTTKDTLSMLCKLVESKVG